MSKVEQAIRSLIVSDLDDMWTEIDTKVTERLDALEEKVGKLARYEEHIGELSWYLDDSEGRQSLRGKWVIEWVPSFEYYGTKMFVKRLSDPGEPLSADSHEADCEMFLYTEDITRALLFDSQEQAQTRLLAHTYDAGRRGETFNSGLRPIQILSSCDKVPGSSDRRRK